MPSPPHSRRVRIAVIGGGPGGLYFAALAKQLDPTHDLVVAADGVNSATRTEYAETFRPTLDARRCKFMWLGTDLVFDAFKFYIAETTDGVMQIHGYPYDATGSTFIVEMNTAVWKRAGFDALAGREFSQGESDEQSIGRIRDQVAEMRG